MQDIKESEWMQQYTAPPSRHDEKDNHKRNNKGFVVRGGPWEQGGADSQVAPDTMDPKDFPAFGTGNASDSNPVVWGPRRF